MADLESIDIHKVSHILLSDGWHAVQAGTFAVGKLTFTGDTSERMQDVFKAWPELKAVANPETVRTNYSYEIDVAQWRESTDSVITAPLVAIVAIRSN